MLKKKLFTIAVLLGALMLIFAFAGCGNSSSADPTSPPNDGGNDPVKTLVSIAVTTLPSKVQYNLNEDLNLSGMIVTATYSDETKAAVTGYSTSGYDKTKTGNQSITVTCKGKSAQFTVTVNDPGKQTVTQPAASEPAGYIASGTGVALSCSTTGAEIWWTYDGSTPEKDGATSIKYTDAFNISNCVNSVTEPDVTVKAIAVMDGWNDSSVLEILYTVNSLVFTGVDKTMATGTVNVAYSQILPAATAIPSTNGTTIRYYLAAGSTLPAGLSLNNATGVVSGTPTAAVTDYKFSITASVPGYITEKAEITITISPAGSTPVLNSITVTAPPTKTTYGVGEPFDSAGMTVDAQYSDGSSSAVTVNASMLSWDFSAAGTKNVTITYQSKSTTTAVTVLSLADRIKTVLGTTATITLYADENIAPSSINSNNNLTAGTNLTLTGSGGIARTISHTAAGYFFYIVQGASLTLDQYVTIDNGSVNDNATMIYVNNGGVMTMKNNSKITGSNTSGNCLGVSLRDSTTFNMEGGTISGITSASASNGAGIYAYRATINISGGTITGNKGVIGGGICLDQCTLNITGGTITGNTATRVGSDIYNIFQSTGTINLSGNPVLGNVVLNAWNSSSLTRIRLNAAFTGSIQSIDLQANSPDMGTVKSWWTNQHVIIIDSGVTADINKFPLRNFYNYDAASSTSLSAPISPAYLDDTGILLNTGSLPAQFSGQGTSVYPYGIGTVAQLANLAALVNAGNTAYNDKYYQLTSDLNLDVSPYNSGTGWTPIAASGLAFTGHFNGANHKISGLFINNPDQPAGLFDVIDGGGDVKNLGLENVNITASEGKNGYSGVGGNGGAGGIVGWLQNGSIINCYTSGTVTGTSGRFTGGIAGMSSGTISDCYSSCDVTGIDYVGGIAGHIINTASNITRCYATGTISGNDRIGGIAGNIETSASVTSCAALNAGVTGATGSTNVGRVAGACSTGVLGGKLSNNIGYDVMLKSVSFETGWTNKGLSSLDGQDIVSSDILYGDGTLGSRFSGNGWTIGGHMLPGLFGSAYDLPGHIQWYCGIWTDNPSTTVIKLLGNGYFRIENHIEGKYSIFGSIGGEITLMPTATYSSVSGIGIWAPIRVIVGNPMPQYTVEFHTDNVSWYCDTSEYTSLPAGRQYFRQ